MSTKEQAIRSAKWFVKKDGTRSFIYRVGPAWMFTGNISEAKSKPSTKSRSKNGRR